MKAYKKIDSVLFLIISAYVAFFFPSSFQGNIDPILQFIQALIISSLLIFFGLINGFNRNNIFIGLFIATMMIFFTLLSRLDYVAIGGSGPYIVMFFLLSTNLKNVLLSEKILKHLLVVNLIIFYLGFGIVLNDHLVISITESIYKAYDDNLFDSMILWHSKPVSVFATHSVAAIAYFCLFLINHHISTLKNISVFKKYIFFISGVLYIILIYLLFSNSSYLLFLLAIFLFISNIFSEYSVLQKIGIFLISTIFLLSFFIFSDIGSNLFNSMKEIYSYDAGGFLGRYTSGGRLQPTYDYIINNPLNPIGLTYGDNLALGDNFIAEYIIKISIFGYFLILLMLYIWLSYVYSKNILPIFLFIFLVDFAYPILTTIRLAGFMPFYFALWLYIESNRTKDGEYAK